MAIRKFNSEEGFSVGLYPSIDVIDVSGNVIANDLTVTSNAYFGTITTVKVYGGSSGQVVTTDGLGNLSFSTVTSGGSAPQGVYGAIQWNDSGVLGGDSVLYYDPLTEVLYSTSFSGDGSQLSNLAGPNVVGDVPNANYATFSNYAYYSNQADYANNVTASNQPNITTVGNLLNLFVDGNISVGGNANLGNTATANFFSGNGALLNHINAAVVIGIVANANYAEYANVTLNSIESNTVTGSSQPNITEVGTLTSLTVTGSSNLDILTANSLVSNSSLIVNGDTTLLGNLIVYGNAVYTDVTTLRIKDPLIELGGFPNGDPLTSNDGFDRGTILHYYTTTPVDAFMGWDTSNSEFSFASNVSYVGNTVTINELGNIRANVFLGNGAALTAITGANVTGAVGNATTAVNANNANFAGNITVASQPNITSVGTLTSLSISGNIDAANANLGNVAIANYFIGNGYNLSQINGANIVGTIGVAANAVSAQTANVSLSVSNSSQPNITQVGTLTTLSLSGTISGVNAFLNVVQANYFIGDGSNISALNASNIVGTVANSNYAGYAGNITIASQPNITTVGVLTSVSTTGNVDAANANLGNSVTANYFIGNASYLTDLQAANIVGIVANATYSEDANNANAALTAGTATIAGTVTTASQPNITSVGILTSLSISGNLTTGNANLGNTVLANYFIGEGNNLSNIQAANVTGIVANANYAAYSNQSNNANVAIEAGTVTTAAQPNITSVGTLSGLTATGTLDFTNASNVSLGAVGNVHITGGTSGYYLRTDGAGNLSWDVAVPQAGGSNTQIQFNDNTIVNGSPNFTFNKTTNVLSVNGAVSVAGNVYRDSKSLTTYVVQSGAPSNAIPGDGWYDTDNDRTYTYTYNGVSYQWVDVTSGYLNANTSAVANTLVLRDLNGNVNANIFNGNNAILTNLTVTTSLVGNTAAFTDAVYANANVTQPHQLATKEYVDQQTTAGLHIHAPVRVKTTGALNASYLNGGTALTVTDITGTNTFTTSVNHGLNVDDTIVPSSSTNGLTAGTAYFVFATPALNTFQLSTTFHGGLASSFTNGTGLTIGVTVNPGMGATLTNSGTQAALTIDTVNVSVNDRVLVASQTNAFENGIYEVSNIGSISTNWILTRASDADQYHPQDVNGMGEGDYFYVSEGLTGAGDSYVLTTEGVIIIGTTNLTYSLFSAAITYSGVSPITVTGQQISLANTTGTSDFVVLANTPQLITPNIGAATGTSVSVTGNVTASYLIGNGSSLTSLTGGNVTGTVANATHASTANTVVNATQGNITSVGTLTSLSVSGNIDIGGNISVTANVTSNNANLGNLVIANYFQGNAANLFGIPGANVTGTVANATHASTANTVVDGAQSNITSVGTLTSLSVSGNANTGNVNTGILCATGNITSANANLGNLAIANFFQGDGYYLSNIAVGNIGTVANANYAAYAGNVVNATQSNITSLGTLTGLSVSGTITSANVNVNSVLGSNNFKSTRSNVAVSTGTIIDQFTTSSYRTAKYILQAQGDIGYQSAEVLLIHDNSDSYITIYGSVYSNVEVVNISSNVVSGNIRLYATAVGANTTVNLLSMYVLD